MENLHIFKVKALFYYPISDIIKSKTKKHTSLIATDSNEIESARMKFIKSMASGCVHDIKSIKYLGEIDYEGYA